MTAITFNAYAPSRMFLAPAPRRFRLSFPTSAIAGLPANLRADAGISESETEAARAIHSPLVDVMMLTRGSRL